LEQNTGHSRRQHFAGLANTDKTGRISCPIT
jgi:hypothetical protein